MNNKYDNLSVFWCNSIYYMQLSELVEKYQGRVHVIDTGQSEHKQSMLMVLEFAEPKRSTFFELKYAEHFRFENLESPEFDWFDDYWENRRNQDVQ